MCEELWLQGTYNYMHFHSIEAWKKSMLKVKNVKKVKKKRVISRFCKKKHMHIFRLW